MEMKYNLTMQEAEDYVTVMRQIFDMVRMISLEGLFSDGFQGTRTAVNVTASGKKKNAVKTVLPEKRQCREK